MTPFTKLLHFNPLLSSVTGEAMFSILKNEFS